ncbi:SDR family NAD(P)-dependent oxidoreductase [Synoicihabitans lomoniglobus]|uniref:SDR family NAD(P)-dependent oxidoreductase n=1 Tax=Synoicihabitans lomoniglobus TaxID=2909285 RepID=A0AAE9ZYZ1_9BACT|nr:SDR family NAD(P)-dependent oxidoreductase [Opitutaceae bacterium LMO-M01]WED65710.1 SDR family NAD(P)-dependent oxidoreductase [Opitutaceae bacterium LMO-M01]
MSSAADTTRSPRDQDIAVIGMACRFPGAPDLAAFLDLLRSGREGITHFTVEELIAAGLDPKLVNRPDYVRANAVLPEPGRFDAAFFGYTPREAELLDIQQRAFLETAWTAVEHAGYDPTQLTGPCGVFAGSGLNTYLLHQIAANPAAIASAGEFQVMIANDKDHLATRVAYKLNLTGPGLTVQTACSTSLVAVHLACQSLLSGESEVALAGGVSIRVPQTTGYLHQEGMILSADGHCRAFDADASGTVGGNGVGAVLLKRASDAIADGDSIHAIVRGSAINNDGAAKVGYTAPGLDGQATVIAEALAVAEVDPDDIGYVETHGTGTKLGDPLEVAALTKAFRRGTKRTGFCALGAVKTNVGHLDAAAGIAGFIKTVLTLRERTFFPTLHYRRANPQIDFPRSPFRVATNLADWSAPSHQTRRAGVSSFGIGGTNVHMVLEEAPSVASPTNRDTPVSSQLFVVSARTAEGRDELASALPAFPLDGHARDAAFTLATGRKAFSARAALVGACVASAQEISRDHADRPRSVAFLFPGQGAQTPGMAAGLYDQDPEFRAVIDRGAMTLQPHLNGRDIRPLLLGSPDDTAAAATLTRTSITQPALFLVSHALAQRWLALGVEPTVMLGHSIGEWVAACLAGVFSVEDALSLVALRGRTMEAQPAGAMLAVNLAETAIRENLPAGLTIAAVNAPDQTVLSGPTDSIEAHATRLQAQGVTALRLRTSHAFHSAAMQPAADALEAALRRITLHRPSRPWISNVTGTWITDDEAISPGYWARQLREPVRFSDGVETLLAQGPTVFLEVGPGRTATGLVRRHADWNDSHRVVASLPPPATAASLLPALGQLWCTGGAVDWHQFYAGETRRRVPLPTYPFGGDVYWIDAAIASSGDSTAPRAPAEWLHLPSWQRTGAPRPIAAVTDGAWAIVGGTASWRDAFHDHLQAAGAAVGEPGSARWIIDLRGTESDAGGTGGFENLRALAAQLAARDPVSASRLLIVTTGLAALAGEQAIQPEKSLLLGPARVLPREVSGCDTRIVDLIASTPLTPAMVVALLDEARSDDGGAVVLWRGGRRWTEAVNALPAPEPISTPTAAPTLITGGLGGLGFAVAQSMAAQADASLVLMGRSPLNESNRSKIATLRAQGATVEYHAIDVTETSALAALHDDLIARGVKCTRLIHAAGQPSSGTLLRSTAANSAAVLAPKVQGTIALWKIWGGDLSHGLVLMSSLSARLGEFGQADYAAANAFLDAFAVAHHTEDRPIISLAWDTWDEVGMAARLSTQPALATWYAERRSWMIKPVDGVNVLRIAIAQREPHVLIATHALEGRQVTPLEASAPAATVTGKPPTRHPRPNLPTAFTSPTSATETRLATIWSELLGIEPVGVQDNFFDLGGHSLLATQVIARLRDRTSSPVTLAAFFEHPTIHGLAELIDGNAVESSAPPPLSPRKHPDHTAPLSFAQESLWLLDRMAGGSVHYNEFGAQRIRGPLQPERLAAALRHVASRHEVLRTAFVEQAGNPVQRIMAVEELDWKLPVLDWSDQPDTTRANALTDLAATLVGTPFDLAQPPLLRARLVRHGESDHSLMIVVHHIVFDGWSSRNFFAEMLAAYAEQELPALAVQYADFAHWQRRSMDGPRRATLETFWREQMTPLSAPLALSTDRPRPTRQTFTGRRQAVVIDAELTAAISQLGRRHDASLFMTVLAGYAAVLARHAAQDEVVIGSPTAGRKQADLEPLIGYFVNPLPLRLAPGHAASFSALMRQTRETLLAAYAHQDLPFSQIVETVAPPRDPARSPLFQAMLVFQNRTPMPAAPAGWSIEAWEPTNGPARSDLDLYLWEQDDHLSGYFLYNTDLFDVGTVDRLTRRLVTFLTHATQTPDAPLGSLKMEASFVLPGLGSRRSRSTDS